ncbi:ral guanine nucleotide dissociation stimulator-like 2, partial [Terrapene carolina triunguis]|uniref:ral guanine nucleotide dissociation stimulator-like 2 n=1 Tax=Terrapene triunguis TaxID=2587831 RepID=UPI0011568BD2
DDTSKPSGADPAPRRQPRRPQEQRPVGVVPYLGTFLRDLVMLDTAMKDELENGYINFEKRRKVPGCAGAAGLPPRLAWGSPLSFSAPP